MVVTLNELEFGSTGDDTAEAVRTVGSVASLAATKLNQASHIYSGKSINGKELKHITKREKSKQYLPSNSELDVASGDLPQLHRLDIAKSVAAIISGPIRPKQMTDLKPIVHYDSAQLQIAMQYTVGFLKRLHAMDRQLINLLRSVSDSACFIPAHQRTLVKLKRAESLPKTNHDMLQSAIWSITNNIYQEHIQWRDMLTAPSIQQAVHGLAWPFIQQVHRVNQAENEAGRTGKRAVYLDALGFFFAERWVIEAACLNVIDMLAILLDDEESYRPIVKGDVVSDTANDPYNLTGHEAFPHMLSTGKHVPNNHIPPTSQQAPAHTPTTTPTTPAGNTAAPQTNEDVANLTRLVEQFQLDFVLDSIRGQLQHAVGLGEKVK